MTAAFRRVLLGLPLLTANVAANAAPPAETPASGAPASVPLLDVHGITLTAAVPDAGDDSLALTLALTPDARDLLLEAGFADAPGRPDDLAGLDLLGPGDTAAIEDTGRRMWRWYDDSFWHDTARSEIGRPTTLGAANGRTRMTIVPKNEWFARYMEQKATTPDGYEVHFRPRRDEGWFFFAVREFSGAETGLRVETHWRKGGTNLGEVLARDGGEWRTLWEGPVDANTFRTEVPDRLARGARWDAIEQDSFRLIRRRVMLLLGPQADDMLRSLGQHPDRLRCPITLRPGPNAARVVVEKIAARRRVEKTVADLDRSRVGANVDATGISVPGAVAAKFKLGVRYERETLDGEVETKAADTDIAYGKLKKKFPGPADPTLYLCVLHQAFALLKPSAEGETDFLLSDVLANAERTIERPGRSE